MASSASRTVARLALAALLVACAGCAAPDDEAAGAGPAGTGSPSASGTPSSVPMAPAGSRNATGTAPAVTETPVRVEGSTAAGACAAGQCHYELTDTAFGELPQAGLGLRLSGTLAWDAAAPTSETLTLYVPTFVDGEYHWEAGDPSASGTSPLVFDLDLSGLASTRLGLIVGNGVATGSPLGVFALQTPQPFLLEATYTSQGA